MTPETEEQRAARLEIPFIALNARFIEGDKLSRREQRRLHLYLMNKQNDELQHICHSLGADALHNEDEEVSDGMDDS